MEYLSQVNALYPSLSKSEKKIADYIKSIGIEIIYMTLQEVSSEADAGEATILRFCRKIGYDGFQNLKLEIAKENSFSSEKDDDEDFTSKIARNMCKSINETKNAINQRDIDKAIELIKKADTIFLCGAGTSGEVAKEMQMQLMRYGKVCSYVCDSHFQLTSCSIAKNKDLIIAFTLSGSTIDTIDSLRIARKHGVNIIVVTNYILSPAASYADCVLLTVGKESPLEGGSFTARASQQYISDILVTGYALKNEEAIRIKQRTAEAVVVKTLQ